MRLLRLFLAAVALATSAAPSDPLVACLSAETSATVETFSHWASCAQSAPERAYAAARAAELLGPDDHARRAELWGSVLANFQPGHQDAWVDYHNDKRAPLLFLSGAEDHLMPPAVQKSNAKHYKSKAITELKEYPGRAHLMPAQQGWEEVADYALEWAERHAVIWETATR